jgi:hypothetical protein
MNENIVNGEFLIAMLPWGIQEGHLCPKNRAWSSNFRHVRNPWATLNDEINEIKYQTFVHNQSPKSPQKGAINYS